MRLIRGIDARVNETATELADLSKRVHRIARHVETLMEQAAFVRAYLEKVVPDLVKSIGQRSTGAIHTHIHYGDAPQRPADPDKGQRRG
jgi:hypothetical protein